jgi:hypothetical protein
MYHQDGCSQCIVLIDVASYIQKEGIIKVAAVFKKHYPNRVYKSDKFIRYLMQLPVVIFKYEVLFVTEQKPNMDYRKMIDWMGKVIPKKQIESRVNKDTLKSLCELASTESDRKLIKAVATWSISGKEAKKCYGIDDNAMKIKQVNEAIVVANDIRQSTMELAQLQDTALLKSMGIEDDISSESDTDGSEYDTDCWESDPDNIESTVIET